jgi:catechol 2,3-dioxygenase-like lactoylglutathione lyase family enzyme
MKQFLAMVSLVVRDYDEAIEFFVGTLGFVLVEDSAVPDQGKRWVVVAPPGGGQSRLLLARASTPEQQSREAHRARGVVFVREPKEEPYGTVEVFKELYGNLWDLVQPK